MWTESKYCFENITLANTFKWWEENHSICCHAQFVLCCVCVKTNNYLFRVYKYYNKYNKYEQRFINAHGNLRMMLEICNCCIYKFLYFNKYIAIFISSQQYL